MQDIILNHEISHDEDIVKKENVLILAGAFLLGMLVNILFYGNPLGISYPIFVSAFYLVFFFLFKNEITIKLNFGWLLSIPIAGLSITYVMFTNPVFAFFNFFAIPVLLVIQTIILTGNGRHAWTSIRFIEDIVLGFLYRTFAHIAKPFTLISRILESKKKSHRLSVFGKVAAGLLISIPLLVIVVMLLASADQIFNNLLGKLPDFFINVDVYGFMIRSVLVISVTVISFSYFWSLKHNKPEVENAGAKVNVIKPFWDPLTITTVVIAVNIVYVIFVIIQFTYLFGGVSSGLPEGFNHSEYARRGFFELVAVTVINLSILLCCINFTKPGSIISDKLLRSLYSLLVGCTFVMLASAHFRMSLYEQTYGYTYLRVFTHTFMVFIFVLLALALWKVWNDKVMLVKYYVVTAIAAYLIINFMNVDAFIARTNIDRYISSDQSETFEIDAPYLTNLSYESVPYLVELLNDKDENTAVIIENHLYSLKEELKDKKSWQSFNLSKSRAADILEKYSLEYRAERYEDQK